MNSALRVFIAAFAGASVAVAWSQFTPARAKKSDEILVKARQLDLLNHLLPLVMTKDQLNKVLTVVERCRAKVDRIRLDEANELLKYEPKIIDAIDRGVNKDLVPSKTLMVDLAKSFNAFSIRRQVAAGENADEVLAVMKKELNAGQLKAAANSHDHKVYDPNLDVSKLTEDDKLKFYIKDVILDPSCYELLIKLTKTAR